MARARKTVAASSRMIPRILAALRERGVDASAIAREVGLPHDAERLDEIAVTPDDFEHLLAAAARALGDPLVAVHLPDLLRWQSYNIGELAARASPTLRDALARVSKYAPIFYAHLAFRVEERGGELVVEQRLASAGPGGRYGNEYGVAALVFHARAIAGADLSPVRVFFRHAALPARERDAIRAHFGARRVDFGWSSNGVAFAAADADRPSRASDPRLLATADALAERVLAERPPAHDFLRSLEAKLRGALGEGSPDAASIARRLRLGTRTLQRRLEERGTTFKDVLERVRREVALEGVRDPSLPLAEVAARAGFSDVATFGRAFKRWTGTSPGRARRSEA